MQTSRCLFAAAVLSCSLAAAAQTRSDISVSSAPAQTTPGAPSNAPLTLTLQDALERAKANSPQFQAAVTALGLAHGDKVQARAATLPNVNYTMAYINTQGVGVATGVAAPPTTPRFVANNGVHEYIAQGVFSQALSGGLVADYRRTAALEAAARARQEIASRGLVVTVVGAYYGYLVAQRKYATEQQAFAEAERFLISRKNWRREGR